MKICLVSSWNERCGVAEYSKNLVNGLLSKGIEVNVVANYPLANLMPDEPVVKRCFHTPFMTKQTTADVPAMVEHAKGCEIVHVQFETSLYHPSWFTNFIQRLSPKKIIFTMHSSGIWPGFHIGAINKLIAHERICSSNIIIPMGVMFFEDQSIPDYKSITSFGLGRNNDDMVRGAIEGTGSTFNPTYGRDDWLPLQELVKALHKHWIITLIYPETGADVCSSAAMLALGCDRPLIVTDTNWFKTIKHYPGVYVSKNLKETIAYLTDEKNRNEIISKIAERKAMIISEGRTFDKFIDRHIEVYQKLL